MALPAVGAGLTLLTLVSAAGRLAALVCVGLVVVVLLPRLVVAALAVLLGALPFASVGVAGLQLPTFLVVELLVVARLLLDHVGLGNTGLSSRRLATPVVVVVVVGALLSFLRTRGAFGRADDTEFLKWFAAVSLIWIVIALDSEARRLFFRVFCISVALGAVYATATALLPQGQHYLQGLSLFGYQRSGADARVFTLGDEAVSARAAGSYNDPNTAALFFLVAYAFAGHISSKLVRRLVRVVVVVGLLATLSRSGLLGGLVALLALILLSRVHLRQRLAAASLIVVILLAAFFYGPLATRLTTSLGSEDRGAVDRQTAVSGFSSVMDGDWLAGKGWGRPEFRDAQTAYKVNVAANATLAATYRGGLLAGIPFLVAQIFTLGLLARRLRRSSGLELSFALVVLGLLASTQFGYGAALIPQVVALNACLLGGWLVLIKSEQPCRVQAGVAEDVSALDPVRRA